MSLGERIYRLRTEKNLSQGDLAEMLAVSRQSISKWENNSATPDLEKIVKLSEIFGISLDELVKGENISYSNQNVMVSTAGKTNDIGSSQRKIVGIILLCVAFVVILLFMAIGGGLSGIIFALPFLTCGILCFVLKRNIGFWCAWALYILFSLYMYWATGIMRTDVLFTFMWTEEMNYLRLAIAWGMVLVWLALIVVSVIKFRKKPFSSLEQGKKMIIWTCTIFVVVRGVELVFLNAEVIKYVAENMREMYSLLREVSLILSMVHMIIPIVVIVFIARYIEMKKQK